MHSYCILKDEVSIRNVPSEEVANLLQVLGCILLYQFIFAVIAIYPCPASEFTLLPINVSYAMAGLPLAPISIIVKDGSRDIANYLLGLMLSNGHGLLVYGIILLIEHNASEDAIIICIAMVGKTGDKNVIDEAAMAVYHSGIDVIISSWHPIDIHSGMLERLFSFGLGIYPDGIAQDGQYYNGNYYFGHII